MASQKKHEVASDGPKSRIDCVVSLTASALAFLSLCLFRWRCPSIPGSHRVYPDMP
jgi:hypothetical protein